jgi:propanol-preferring alcohol dehydrogenase
MSELMRAWRIPEPSASGVWAEIPVPTPAMDQVLLKMRAAGICRTDLEIMDHGVQFAPWKGAYTLGHENIGEIVEVGSSVTSVKVGQSVVVNAAGTCGTCRNCRTGNDNFCTNRPGVYGTWDDGGLAPYMVARERDVLSIGGLSPEQAAPLGDAGATAIGAVNATLPYIGDNGFVVVIGIGGLGSFALQLLRLKTPATIVAVDMPDRLAHAEQRGAHLTIASNEQTAEAITEATGGAGVDVVLDFVGTDATLAMAAQVTRSMGCVRLIGTGGGSLPFSFMGSQLGVNFSTQASCTLAELADALLLTERGLLTVDTTFYSFDQLEQAYDDLRGGKIVGRGVITFD